MFKCLASNSLCEYLLSESVCGNICYHCQFVWLSVTCISLCEISVIRVSLCEMSLIRVSISEIFVICASLCEISVIRVSLCEISLKRVSMWVVFVICVCLCEISVIKISQQELFLITVILCQIFLTVTYVGSVLCTEAMLYNLLSLLALTPVVLTLRRSQDILHNWYQITYAI